jgi:hypothetical protein
LSNRLNFAAISATAPTAIDRDSISEMRQKRISNIQISLNDFVISIIAASKRLVNTGGREKERENL